MDRRTWKKRKRKRVRSGVGWWAVLAMVGVLGMAGCQTDSGLQKKSAEKGSLLEGADGTPVKYDLDAIRDGAKLEIPTDEPDSVLKRKNGAAAWSAEARAIERSLGVMP